MSTKKDDKKNDSRDYIDFSEEPEGVMTFVFDIDELNNPKPDENTNPEELEPPPRR
ncbi:TPA: hypothetical protein ACIT51_000150 [Salmonella enterica subsp. enterica serovar Java]